MQRDFIHDTIDLNSSYYVRGKRSIAMERKQYVCPKCGCTQYESDQFQATGGNFAKMFDIQNKRFTTISCSRCGYTELYKKAADDAMDILDFLIGG